MFSCLGCLKEQRIRDNPSPATSDDLPVLDTGASPRKHGKLSGNGSFISKKAASAANPFDADELNPGARSHSRSLAHSRNASFSAPGHDAPPVANGTQPIKPRRTSNRIVPAPSGDGATSGRLAGGDGHRHPQHPQQPHECWQAPEARPAAQPSTSGDGMADSRGSRSTTGSKKRLSSVTSGGDPLAAALVALRGVQAGGRDAMARAARRASSGADPQFQSYTMRNWASFSAGPAAARREMRSYSHGTGLGQQSQECASPRGVYREGARAQSHCFGGICVMDASGVEEQEEEEHARRRRAHQQQGRHCSADGELEDVADGGAYSGGHGQVRGASGMTSEMGSEKGSWRDPGDGREGEELAVPQSKSGPPYGSKSGTGEPGVLLDEQSPFQRSTAPRHQGRQYPQSPLGRSSSSKNERGGGDAPGLGAGEHSRDRQQAGVRDRDREHAESYGTVEGTGGQDDRTSQRSSGGSSQRSGKGGERRVSLPNAVEAVVQQEEQEGWGSRGRGRSGGSGSGGRAHEQGPGGEEEAEAEELQGSSDEVEEGEGRGGLPGGDPSLEMLERNPSEVWHQVRQLTPKRSILKRESSISVRRETNTNGPHSALPHTPRGLFEAEAAAAAAAAATTVGRHSSTGGSAMGPGGGPGSVRGSEGGADGGVGEVGARERGGATGLAGPEGVEGGGGSGDGGGEGGRALQSSSSIGARVTRKNVSFGVRTERGGQETAVVAGEAEV